MELSLSKAATLLLSSLLLETYGLANHLPQLWYWSDEGESGTGDTQQELSLDVNNCSTRLSNHPLAFILNWTINNHALVNFINFYFANGLQCLIVTQDCD